MKKVIRVEDIKTLEEIAKELDVSKDTIDRWRQKGMPIISIDKYVRIWMPDVLEWLVKQKETLITDNSLKNLAK
jgi:hypothetical protein